MNEEVLRFRADIGLGVVDVFEVEQGAIDLGDVLGVVGFPKSFHVWKEAVVIAELRETASDYLKTRERQKPLVEYARAHFGGRAFDG